jgi:ATP-binding cassette subfamily F protein uup
MANLINLEKATVGYGTRTLLDGVSLGVEEGDAIGVVGRNGDGKTTLLKVLTGTQAPDSGRATHTSGLSVG